MGNCKSQDFQIRHLLAYFVSAPFMIRSGKENKWAVIGGNIPKVLGYYGSFNAGVDAGYEHYRESPFICQQVNRRDFSPGAIKGLVGYLFSRLKKAGHLEDIRVV